MASSNLKDIKRRIRSVESTMQITKAMELVASSKFRKAKDQAEAVEPFFTATYKLMAEIASEDSYFNSQFVHRKVEKGSILLVVIAGDRGLAGGFNSAILKKAQARIDALAQEGIQTVIMPIGQRAVEYFERTESKILKSYHHISEHISIYLAMDMAERLVQTYHRHPSIQGVELIYTNYVSPLIQEAQHMKVIPLTELRNPTGRNCVVEYEPSPEAVFDKLIPQYLSGLLYGAIIESFASEQAARRTAMENATDNATEMLDTLSLLYNRARQTAITQEITEIVGGANAQQ